MEIELFVFLMDDFHFFKFHENETKQDKANFKGAARDIRGQKFVKLLEKLD